MKTTVRKEIQHILFIQGLAPELLRGVVFRRKKHFQTQDKKILKCPYCGKEFETVDSAVKVTLYSFPAKAKVTYHSSIPCRICRNKVGIVFASA